MYRVAGRPAPSRYKQPASGQRDLAKRHRSSLTNYPITARDISIGNLPAGLGVCASRFLQGRDLRVARPRRPQPLLSELRRGSVSATTFVLSTHALLSHLISPFLDAGRACQIACKV